MSHFTGTKLKALQALIDCPSVRASAVAVQCSERQLYRYLEDADFLAELRRLEGQVLDNTVRRLTSLSVQAVQVLTDVMTYPSQEGAGLRLRAAGIVLDNVLKWREL